VDLDHASSAVSLPSQSLPVRVVNRDLLEVARSRQIAMTELPHQLSFLSSTKTAKAGTWAPSEALSQWFTPQWLARMLAREWLEAKRSLVLEPSAGTGNVVAELVEAGAWVTACEIDPHLVKKLRSRFRGKDVEIVPGDFLARPAPKADVCVQNPPYEGRLDERFIMHVLNGGTPSTIALLRLNVLCGRNRYDDLWTQVAVTRAANLIDRPDFGGVYTAMTDFVVLELERRKRTRKSGSFDRVKMEWWQKPVDSKSADR
jgi:SAM-dependent methyltransferase